MSGTAHRSAGRPREFELEVAVESALETFWGRPFADVSVSDLEHSTGVVRTSLYNAFGNKRGLFNAALELYLSDLFAQIDRRLTQGTAGLDDVHRFLDWLQLPLTTSTRGCLMVNSMIEFGDTDPVIAERAGDHTRTLSDALRAALSRARDGGELRAAISIEATADQLTLQILGLNLAARVGPDPEQLQQLFKATHDGIRALRRKEPSSATAATEGRRRGPKPKQGGRP